MKQIMEHNIGKYVKTISLITISSVCMIDYVYCEGGFSCYNLCGCCNKNINEDDGDSGNLGDTNGETKEESDINNNNETNDNNNEYNDNSKLQYEEDEEEDIKNDENNEEENDENNEEENEYYDKRLIDLEEKKDDNNIFNDKESSPTYNEYYLEKQFGNFKFYGETNGIKEDIKSFVNDVNKFDSFLEIIDKENSYYKSNKAQGQQTVEEELKEINYYIMCMLYDQLIKLYKKFTGIHDFEYKLYEDKCVKQEIAKLSKYDDILKIIYVLHNIYNTIYMSNLNSEYAYFNPIETIDGLSKVFLYNTIKNSVNGSIEKELLLIEKSCDKECFKITADNKKLLQDSIKIEDKKDPIKPIICSLRNNIFFSLIKYISEYFDLYSQKFGINFSKTEIDIESKFNENFDNRKSDRDMTISVLLKSDSYNRKDFYKSFYSLTFSNLNKMKDIITNFPNFNSQSSIKLYEYNGMYKCMYDDCNAIVENDTENEIKLKELCIKDNFIKKYGRVVYKFFTSTITVKEEKDKEEKDKGEIFIDCIIKNKGKAETEITNYTFKKKKQIEVCKIKLPEVQETLPMVNDMITSELQYKYLGSCDD